MKKLIWFLLCLNLTILGGCSGDTGEQSKNTQQFDVGTLNLELVISDTKFPIGKSIEFDIVLKNIGDVPVLVNQRLFITPPYLPEELKAIEMDITSPSGDVLKYSCSVWFDPINDEDFLVLKYGYGLTRTVNLDCFPINEIGTYSIRAIYSNSSDKQDGSKVWKGVLESNTVTFEVIE